MRRGANPALNLRSPPVKTALVPIVVVTCRCGHLPLNSHRTSAAAWQFAADHVALNPTLCKPDMGRDLVPAALATSA
jgi:hypothetical protein